MEHNPLSTQPKSRAELASIKRGKARQHALDEMRRAASALSAAMQDEPNSEQSLALHDLRNRLRSLIAELRLLG